MKVLPVLFTGLAEEDLDQIEDYIAARDPAAAARVRTAIVRQSMSLGKAPEKGMRLSALPRLMLWRTMAVLTRTAEHEPG